MSKTRLPMCIYEYKRVGDAVDGSQAAERDPEKECGNPTRTIQPPLVYARASHPDSLVENQGYVRSWFSASINQGGYLGLAMLPTQNILSQITKFSGLNLQIVFWTTVQVTDEHAGNAISLYLERDHPILGLLDADLSIASFVGCDVSKLLSLAESLFDSPARSEHDPVHVFIFHIWFHATVLDMIRPFISKDKQHGFHSWSPSAMSPEAIFAASVKRLKCLTLIYMGEHPSAAYTVCWYMANMVLCSPKDPERQFYILLYIS
ncbi:hypothetical protein K469DRAFT_793960 [Zopfia rhizophila CBS 207.26]|uniref:Uncharacterized protein n=1 Tax=Zopfia rhizophila CBS 207.26 TaxID=1314779 RepID=A0A6A6DPB4_9PEZI|nr:hypothetical protein K469DRAFT_793960 [Zopfia rhizophila CBS 207.26]